MRSQKRTKRTKFVVLFFTLFIVLIVACTTERPAIPETPPVPEPPREIADTTTLLNLAVESLEKDDYTKALAFFDDIKAEDADKAEIKLLKASVLISAGKFDEAQSIAKEVLEDSVGRGVSLEAAVPGDPNHPVPDRADPNHIDPNHVEALLVLASVEEARNKNREQRALLEQALALEPENTRALVSMGKLMIRNNASPLAGPYFDRALALEPENGEALLGRAWVYRNARDSKQALALLDRAVDLYPQWDKAFQERGRLYKALGRNGEALADLDRAARLSPNDYFIACDWGGALQNLGRKQDALAEYARAAAINPNHFLAYVFSAGLRDELGDREGAFKDYAALARLNPDYYFAFEGLGMHLARLSRWLEARGAFVEAYRRALRMDAPTTDEGMYALLAALAWQKSAVSGGGRRPGSRGNPIGDDARAFIDGALKRLPRDLFEYQVLLMYRDGRGDAELAARADREQNPSVKARLLFYVAWYYDIRGNKNLANKLFVQVRDLDVKTITEWRLNEWTLEARGLSRDE